MNRYCLYIYLLASLLMLAAKASAIDPPQFKVLMITATRGWHHQAVAAAVPAMEKLAKKHHFALTWEANIDRVFTEQTLAEHDVILFLLTTGDILNKPQQDLMKAFIQRGKGFVGIHSAADTEHTWPWYNALVGRMFIIHPVIQTAKLRLESRQFPGLARLPDTFWFTDEYYEFGEETTSGLNYLLSVDETTYDPVADWGEKRGQGMGAFHPLAWYHHYDGGRAFYTALGHVPAVYQDTFFLEHVYGGLFWAATGRGAEKSATTKR